MRGFLPGESGFTRVTFTGNADFYIDNITGLELEPGPDPIPEPTTWAMLILGFGAVGGALRIGRARRFAAVRV